MSDHSGPRGSQDEDWELLGAEASRSGSPAPMGLGSTANQDVQSIVDGYAALHQTDTVEPKSDSLSDLTSSLSHVPSITFSDSQDSQSLLLVARSGSSPTPKFPSSPFAAASDSHMTFSSTSGLHVPSAVSPQGSSMSDRSAFDTDFTSSQYPGLDSSAAHLPQHTSDNSDGSSVVRLSLQPDTSNSNRLVYAALGVSNSEGGVTQPRVSHTAPTTDDMLMKAGDADSHDSSSDEAMMEDSLVRENSSDAISPVPHARQPVTLLLLGKTGNGKSATGNTILGRRAFQAKCSASSVTTHSQAETTTLDGRAVTVIDTPGLFDTAASQSEVCTELARAMAMSEEGIHAILLVLTASSRFTAEEVACLNYLRSAYGGQLLRHCILVFTHGDSLEEEDMPLHEFLRNCPESLQVVLNEVQGRQVAINNRAGNSNGQVDILLGLVDWMLVANNQTLFKPSDITLPADVNTGEAGSEDELQKLRMKYDKSEAARHDLEKRVRASCTMQKRLLTACTVGGLLGWRLLHTGGGSTSIPVSPPVSHTANLDPPGQVTWAFEPAALGLTNCAAGSEDKINMFPCLDRLIPISSHQQ